VNKHKKEVLLVAKSKKKRGLPDTKQLLTIGAIFAIVILMIIIIDPSMPTSQKTYYQNQWEVCEADRTFLKQYNANLLNSLDQQTRAYLDCANSRSRDLVREIQARELQ